MKTILIFLILPILLISCTKTDSSSSSTYPNTITIVDDNITYNVSGVMDLDKRAGTGSIPTIDCNINKEDRKSWFYITLYSSTFYLHLGSLESFDTGKVCTYKWHYNTGDIVERFSSSPYNDYQIDSGIVSISNNTPFEIVGTYIFHVSNSHISKTITGQIDINEPAN